MDVHVKSCSTIIVQDAISGTITVMVWNRFCSQSWLFLPVSHDSLTFMRITNQNCKLVGELCYTSFYDCINLYFGPYKLKNLYNTVVICRAIVRKWLWLRYRHGDVITVLPNIGLHEISFVDLKCSFSYLYYAGNTSLVNLKPLCYGRYDTMWSKSPLITFEMCYVPK